MSEADAVPKHPLVQLVLSAKAILDAQATPMGPSKADTIADLCTLLDSRAAKEAIAAHDRLVVALDATWKVVSGVDTSPAAYRDALVKTNEAGVLP